MISMLPPQNVMSLPVRGECRRLAAVPLHSQLNHPKGGCITPLGRLKVSPGEDHAADDCRQRSVVTGPSCCRHWAA
jgi:hypothetical protein